MKSVILALALLLTPGCANALLPTAPSLSASVVNVAPNAPASPAQTVVNDPPPVPPTTEPPPIVVTAPPPPPPPVPVVGLSCSARDAEVAIQIAHGLVLPTVIRLSDGLRVYVLDDGSVKGWHVVPYDPNVNCTTETLRHQS